MGFTLMGLDQFILILINFKLFCCGYYIYILFFILYIYFLTELSLKENLVLIIMPTMK